MIGPPAAARALTARPLTAMALSVAIALLTAWSAIAAAYATDYPVGFYVGAVSAACFAAARAWSCVDGALRPRPAAGGAGSRLGDAMSAEDERGWYEQATRALAAAGYRRGGARHAVLELLDAQPCGRSAIEIEDALAAAAARAAGLAASIYRILDELESLGLVARLEVGSGVVRFEAVREGSGHHHHLVCDVCGTLTPFSDPELERAIDCVSRRVALDGLRARGRVARFVRRLFTLSRGARHQWFSRERRAWNGEVLVPTGTDAGSEQSWRDCRDRGHSQVGIQGPPLPGRRFLEGL